MTSLRAKIPINPDLYYPVVLKWANGRIRETKGSYLLSVDNPESWRYIESKDKYPRIR
jgi:hypothetical protein